MIVVVLIDMSYSYFVIFTPKYAIDHIPLRITLQFTIQLKFTGIQLSTEINKPAQDSHCTLAN